MAATYAHLLILVAVILLLTSLYYLRIQTRSAWILNSSFHVLTATSMSRGFTLGSSEINNLVNSSMTP